MGGQGKLHDWSEDDFVDELIDIEPDERWLDSAFDAPSDWAKPDPTVGASSDLSESLHPPDNSITDISHKLRGSSG